MSYLKAAILPGLLLAAAPLPAGGVDEGARSWHFTVLVDGKRIGEHDFMVTREGDEVIVDSTAHFKATVAFIPVYVYDHQDHEVWRNGCVISIASRTNDNGRKDYVQGELEDQMLEVRSARAASTRRACVRTFAYWNESLLAPPPLMNSQTGEFQSVTLSPAADDSIRVLGETLAAKRYGLRGPHLSIDLWYSGAGDWLALESTLDSGRTLRYEIR